MIHPSAYQKGMNMYILSQDGKTIIKAVLVKVEKNFGGKAHEKYMLIGYTAANDSFPVTLGGFPTEDDAKCELSHIYEAISSGATAYTVSH